MENVELRRRDLTALFPLSLTYDSVHYFDPVRLATRLFVVSALAAGFLTASRLLRSASIISATGLACGVAVTTAV